MSKERNMDSFRSPGGVYVETDKTRELQDALLNPHYTDQRFRDSQTVFLAPGHTTVRQYGADMVEGASYDYSDRLYEWHGEKCDKAWETVEAKGLTKNSAAMLETYLQELLGDADLQLVHLVTGVNLGNGYPYRLYGYMRGHQEEQR